MLPSFNDHVKAVLNEANLNQAGWEAFADRHGISVERAKARVAEFDPTGERFKYASWISKHLPVFANSFDNPEQVKELLGKFEELRKKKKKLKGEAANIDNYTPEELKELEGSDEALDPIETIEKLGGDVIWETDRWVVVDVDPEYAESIGGVGHGAKEAPWCTRFEDTAAMYNFPPGGLKFIFSKRGARVRPRKKSHIDGLDYAAAIGRVDEKVARENNQEIEFQDGSNDAVDESWVESNKAEDLVKFLAGHYGKGDIGKYFLHLLTTEEMEKAKERSWPYHGREFNKTLTILLKHVQAGRVWANQDERWVERATEAIQGYIQSPESTTGRPSKFHDWLMDMTQADWEYYWNASEGVWVARPDASFSMETWLQRDSTPQAVVFAIHPEQGAQFGTSMSQQSLLFPVGKSSSEPWAYTGFIVQYLDPDTGQWREGSIARGRTVNRAGEGLAIILDKETREHKYVRPQDIVYPWTTVGGQQFLHGPLAPAESFNDHVEEVLNEAVPAGFDNPKLLKEVQDQIIRAFNVFAKNPQDLYRAMDVGNFLISSGKESVDITGEPFEYNVYVRYGDAGNRPPATQGTAGWKAPSREAQIVISAWFNGEMWQDPEKHDELEALVRNQVQTSLDHEIAHIQRILAPKGPGFAGEYPEQYQVPGYLRRKAAGEIGQRDYQRFSPEWDATVTALVRGYERMPDEQKATIHSVVDLFNALYGKGHPRTEDFLKSFGQDSIKWQRRTLSRLNREGVPIRRWGESFEAMVASLTEGKRICAWCGKELGEWEGEGESHGICDDCAKKLYGEMGEEPPERLKKDKKESFESLMSEHLDEANLQRHQWSDYAKQLGTDMALLRQSVAQVDPTQDRTKYASWIVKQMIAFGDSWQQAAEYTAGLLDRYEQLKARKKLTPEHTDLDRAAPSVEALSNLLGQYPEGAGTTQQALDSAKASIQSDGGRVVAEGGPWLVVQLPDEKAASYVGHGGGWCIKDKEWFGFYNFHGPLYIVFSTERTEPYKPSSYDNLRFALAINARKSGVAELRDATDLWVTESWFEKNDPDGALRKMLEPLTGPGISILANPHISHHTIEAEAKTYFEEGVARSAQNEIGAASSTDLEARWSERGNQEKQIHDASWIFSNMPRSTAAMVCVNAAADANVDLKIKPDANRQSGVFVYGPTDQIVNEIGPPHILGVASGDQGYMMFGQNWLLNQADRLWLQVNSSDAHWDEALESFESLIEQAYIHDSYWDIGHDEDDTTSQVWWMPKDSDDLKIGDPGKSHRDYNLDTREMDACGRIDHSNAAISIVVYDPEANIDYTKKLLAMDYPGYAIKACSELQGESLLSESNDPIIVSHFRGKFPDLDAVRIEWDNGDLWEYHVPTGMYDNIVRKYKKAGAQSVATAVKQAAVAEYKVEDSEFPWLESMVVPKRRLSEMTDSEQDEEANKMLKQYLSEPTSIWLYTDLPVKDRVAWAYLAADRFKDVPDSEDFLKKFIEALKLTVEDPETFWEQIREKDAKRADYLDRGDWKLETVSLESIGVYPKFSGFGDEYCTGSVLDTAEKIKGTKEYPLKRSRLMDMSEKWMTITKFLPPILVPGGTLRGRHDEYEEKEYDVDDGNHRLVAAALAGATEAICFVSGGSEEKKTEESFKEMIEATPQSVIELSEGWYQPKTGEFIAVAGETHAHVANRVLGIQVANTMALASMLDAGWVRVTEEGFNVDPSKVRLSSLQKYIDANAYWRAGAIIYLDLTDASSLNNYATQMHIEDFLRARSWNAVRKYQFESIVEATFRDDPSFQNISQLLSNYERWLLQQIAIQTEPEDAVEHGVGFAYYPMAKLLQPEKGIQTYEDVSQALDTLEYYGLITWSPEENAEGELESASTEWAENGLKLAEYEDMLDLSHEDDSPQDILERAVELFGTTDDPREAGFILPDGIFLDFSGMRQGSMAPGHRYMDHNEIGSLPGVDGHEEFCAQTGAVRMGLAGDYVFFDIRAEPSYTQQRVMMNIMAEYTDYNADIEALQGSTRFVFDHVDNEADAREAIAKSVMGFRRGPEPEEPKELEYQPDPYLQDLWQRKATGESLDTFASLVEEVEPGDYEGLMGSLSRFYGSEYKYSQIKQGQWLGEQPKEQYLKAYGDMLRASGAEVAEYLLPVYEHWIKMHDWTDAEAFNETRNRYFWDYAEEREDRPFKYVVDLMVSMTNRWTNSPLESSIEDILGNLDFEAYPAIHSAVAEIYNEMKEVWAEDAAEGESVTEYEDLKAFWTDWLRDYGEDSALEALDARMSPQDQYEFTKQLWANYVSPIFIENFSGSVPRILDRIRSTATKVAEVMHNAERFEPSEVATRVNLGLNEAHSSGSMMEYVGDTYGVTEYDLDELSNQDVSTWDEELKQLGTTTAGTTYGQAALMDLWRDRAARGESLAERRSNQPQEIYWHGTSSEFLPSILAKGLIPIEDPEKKAWGSDPDREGPEGKSAYLSRRSYGGTYLTKNFGQAITSASRAVDKFPGTPVMVAMQISPHSLTADEDDVVYKVEQAYNDAVGYHGYDYHFALTYLEALQNPEAHVKYQKAFEDSLISAVQSSMSTWSGQQQELPALLVDRVRQVMQGMFLGYAGMKASVVSDYDFRRAWAQLNSGQGHEGWEGAISLRPNKDEEEAKIRTTADQLTRTLATALTGIDKSFATGRMLDPVDMAGRNRILAIYAKQPGTERNVWKVVYGENTVDLERAFYTYYSNAEFIESLEDQSVQMGLDLCLQNGLPYAQAIEAIATAPGPLEESFSTQKKRFVADGADPELVDAAFSMFKQLKQKNLLEPEEKDIDRYKSLDQLEQMLATKRGAVSKTQQKQQAKVEGADLVFENDLWRVYHITTYEASVLYGKGTKWCISGKTAAGRDYFQDYASNLTIYFAIPKTDENEKIAVAVHPDDDMEIFDTADDEIPELPEGLPGHVFEFIEPEIEPPEPEPEDYAAAQDGWLEVEGYREFEHTADEVLGEKIAEIMGEYAIGVTQLNLLDGGSEDYVGALTQALMESEGRSAVYNLVNDTGGDIGWHYDEGWDPQHGGWDITAWVPNEEIKRLVEDLEPSALIAKLGMPQEQLNALAWEQLYEPVFIDLVNDKFDKDSEATDLWMSVPDEKEYEVFKRAMIASDADTDEDTLDWLPMWDIVTAVEAVTPELIRRATIPGYEQNVLRGDAQQMRLFQTAPEPPQQEHPVSELPPEYQFAANEHVLIDSTNDPDARPEDEQTMSGWIVADENGMPKTQTFDGHLYYYLVRSEQTGESRIIDPKFLSKPYQVVPQESFESMVQGVLLN